MKYLIWLFLPVLVFSQVRTVTQTGIKKTMIRGDLTTLSWVVPSDYSSDSLSFVVKSSADPSGVRLIQKTTGAGNLTATYSSPNTTLTATINTNNTSGFTAATYYYDIYNYTDSVTLVTGILVIMEDVSSPADGISTSTPYYTVAIDTPIANPQILVGYDSTNAWVGYTIPYDSTGLTTGQLYYNSSGIIKRKY